MSLAARKEPDYDQPSRDVSRDGTVTWHVDGKPHRYDGPAVEDGKSLQWYVKGELHRDGGGPAYDGKDGTQVWWIHGKLHREKGPAIIRADGTREWWVHGAHMTKEAFDARNRDLRKSDVAALMTNTEIKSLQPPQFNIPGRKTRPHP